MVKPNILLAVVVLLAASLIGSFLVISRLSDANADLTQRLEESRDSGDSDADMSRLRAENDRLTAEVQRLNEQLGILTAANEVLQERVRTLENQPDPVAQSGPPADRDPMVEPTNENPDDLAAENERLRGELERIRDVLANVKHGTRAEAEQIALELFKAGQYKDAANAFSSAVIYRDGSGSLTDDRLFVYRAVALLHNSNWNGAYFALRHALNVNRGMARESINLRGLYGNIGDLDTMYDYLKDLSIKQTTAPRMRFLLGFMTYYTGSNSEGVKYFNDVLGMDPSFAEATRMLNPE
jgi:tetratricopeptide (TPR) repeat protein